tara:strand:- start:2628 stop:2930 length:303 start_codon:yes stop_codon:yes gene_type:complete
MSYRTYKHVLPVAAGSFSIADQTPADDGNDVLVMFTFVDTGTIPFNLAQSTTARVVTYAPTGRSFKVLGTVADLGYPNNFIAYCARNEEAYVYDPRFELN